MLLDITGSIFLFLDSMKSIMSIGIISWDSCSSIIDHSLLHTQ